MNIRLIWRKWRTKEIDPVVSHYLEKRCHDLFETLGIGEVWSGSGLLIAKARKEILALDPDCESPSAWRKSHELLFRRAAIRWLAHDVAVRREMKQVLKTIDVIEFRKICCRLAEELNLHVSSRDLLIRSLDPASWRVRDMLFESTAKRVVQITMIAVAHDLMDTQELFLRKKGVKDLLDFLDFHMEYPIPTESPT